ncbi:hypothetical protein [Aeromicrobium sp. 179-A 4D2 NHS]|uniref:hypothetical protein n=1 Tax=Aeromicrobium sp. 179-A 4D2 NHS TaxID=3142375 RepID=UPI0039A2A84B
MTATLSPEAPTLDAHHPDVHATFLGDVANHQMTVLRDDGVYRHLRFAVPGENAWHQWFELVTWPGHLVISGDMGSYGPFARHGTTDMFTFFESASANINPSYWAEKLGRSHGDVKEYSPELARKVVLAYWADEADEFEDEDRRWISARLDDLLAYHCDFDAHEMYSALENFKVAGFSFSDVHELDFDEYTFHFLWCCFAIRFGINQYRNLTEGGPLA